MKMNRCQHHGPTDNKCPKKISKKDPEAKFCAAHRRCDFPRANTDEPVVEEEEEEILVSFLTFKSSCLDLET